MASLRVLAFDHEGRPVQLDTWLDDLQLYLLSDSKDSVLLFDLASGAATAPPATADIEDLVSHLRASDARYHAAVPAEFLDRNPPPMDHFLSLDPTSLTVDLLEQHLLAAETSAVAVGASCGTQRPPFFEGCSPSPLAPSYTSAAAADVFVPEDVGAASASAKHHSSKGKGGRGGGGGSGGGRGGSGSGGGGSSGGGGGGGTVGGSGGSGGGGGGSGGSGGSGGGGTGRGGTGAWRVGFGGGQRQQQQRRGETLSPQQLREWFLCGASGGSCPYVIRTGERAGQTCGRLHTQHRCFSRLRVCAEGDCYQCVPPDPRIAAAALGASESGTLPGSAPSEALKTFTLDSSTSRCFFRDSTTLIPLPTPVPVRLADPSGGPVVARSSTVLPCPAVLSGSLLGLHLPSSSTNLVSASGQVAASCSFRLLSHQTLLWHHRLGHPFLPRLRDMHSRLLFSGLPRSLPPLPPSPAPPYLPCVEERLRAAPHSSFPPTAAPLQTLHLDVWGPARVSGQSRERYFLLVVDDYTRTLRLHSDRGGEFWPNRSRDICRGEGIFQSFTLHDSPEQNGIAERCIGLVMEYAAHQLNLWPRVSLPETSPTLRWTGEVGDASVFRVWGSRAFVRDTSADKLSARAIPCVFLGFVPDAPGWQFYHPTLRRVFPSLDVTFDELVPFYSLFPYRFAPPPPPLLFLAPDPLPGPAPVQVAVDSDAARGAASGGAETRGAEPWGVEIGGAEPGGVATWGGEPGGAEPEGVEPGGDASEGAESGGAEPQGAASCGGFAGASPRLSPQELHEWFVRRTRLWRGASGAGGAGPAGDAAGAGVTGGTATTGPGGARTRGTGAAGTGGVEGTRAGDLMESGTTGDGGAGAGGAGVGGPGAGGAGVGGPSVGGAGAGGAGAVDPGGAVRPQPYFVPLLQQVLGTLPSTALLLRSCVPRLTSRSRR
ncbi:unnamed protein product [Closterium sp. NIES-53]